MVIKAQQHLNTVSCSPWPVDLSMYSAHKAAYLAHANMHTNNLLTHSDCHYCKQVL